MLCKMLFVREHLVSGYCSCRTMRYVHLSFNSWPTLTPSNFSCLLLLTVSLPPIFVWKLYLVLFISKWYLSGFALFLLSLNHCNSVLATFYNLIRTSKFLNQYSMGCCRPHSLPKERDGGTKGDCIQIYLITKGQV